MKSKKTLMGIASLMVLIFHFYIPVTDLSIETRLMRACYIGVDIFFFMSAASLGKQERIEFKSFIPNRLKTIYLPFFIYAVIGLIYNSWSAKKFIYVITFIDLFRKGGGAFLWFVPGIMIFYLLCPLLCDLKKKLGTKLLYISLALWLITVIVLQYVFSYTTLFILLNRFPIFMIGFYYIDLKKKYLKDVKVLPLAIMVVLAFIPVYFWGSLVRLNKPIVDLYYILSLPLSLSIIALTDRICDKIDRSSKVLDFIGRYTLDTYALQMIFGFDLEAKILKLTRIGILSFVLTCIILIISAILMLKLREKLIDLIIKKEK